MAQLLKDISEGSQEARDLVDKYTASPTELVRDGNRPIKMSTRGEISEQRRKEATLDSNEKLEGLLYSYVDGQDPRTYADGFVARLRAGVEYRNADGTLRRVISIEGDHIVFETPGVIGMGNTRLSGLRDSVAARPSRTSIIG